MDDHNLQRIQNAIRAFNSRTFDSGTLSLDAWLEIVTEDLVPRDAQALRYFVLDDLRERKNAGTGVETLLHLWDGADGWLDYSGYTGHDSPLLLVEEPFYGLNLPRDAVLLVDSRISFLSVMELLMTADIIGIDGEWKPDVIHSHESMSRLSILQIATRSHCYLFDFLRLRLILTDDDWKQLSNIFNSPGIVKLGFALQGDFARLEDIDVFSQETTANYPNLFDVKVIVKRLASEKPEIFCKRASGEVCGNLSGIVQLLFGVCLDKREQISNWERRPLREAQVVYAALDAFCLIKIWDALSARCSALNVRFPPHHLSVAEEELELELAAFPVINQDEPIDPSAIKLICDTHLKGLSRRLRNIGVDTEFADQNWSDQRILQEAMKEDRIFLTSPAKWKSARKQLPSGCCFWVSNTAKSIRQLEYVVRMFNIAITKDDVLSRCSACNGPKFIHANREQVVRLIRVLAPGCPAVRSDSSESRPENPRDQPIPEAGTEFANCFKNTVDAAGSVDFHTGRVIASSAVIDVAALQEHKMQRVTDYYICCSCGKMYWPGTHFRRMWHVLIANKLVA